MKQHHRTILVGFLFLGLLSALNFHDAIEAVSQPEQIQWFRVGQTNFPGGFGQAMVTDGQDLYILRQFIENTRLDFQKLTVTDGVVTRTANLQAPPHDAKNGTTVVADPDGNLYALLGGDYTELRHHFVRFSGGRWTALDPTPYAQGAGDAMTFVSHRGERFLYAIVGASSMQRPGAVTKFLRYSLSKSEWELMPDPPWECSDDGSSLAWDGEEFIYAFQGSDCEDEPTTTFARYYLTLGLWETLPELPSTIDYGGSLVWDGSENLYAIAGTATEFEGRSFYRYKLLTGEWQTEIPQLNCSVGDYNGNRLAVIDRRIFYWQGTPPTWVDSPECNGRGIYAFAWR